MLFQCDNKDHENLNDHENDNVNVNHLNVDAPNQLHAEKEVGIHKPIKM